MGWGGSGPPPPVDWDEYDREHGLDQPAECPCGWSGTRGELVQQRHGHSRDMNCPECGRTIASTDVMY